jgi:hypothetical protein
MTPWTGFFIWLYLGVGWLFARQFQRSSELDPHRINHALTLMMLLFLWPLGVVFMLITLSMIVLFPRIKK